MGTVSGVMQDFRVLSEFDERQFGFGLIDLVVAIAIVSGILLVASTTFGTRVPNAHQGALALQAAFAEARSIATMQQADGTDTGLPTGATVSVAIDPEDQTKSIISVFRSRPIENPDASLSGAKPVTLDLPADSGFPAQRVAALFTVRQTGKASQTGTFTVLISSSGYSSIVPDYAYAPGSAILTADPSCSDAGTTIAAATGGQSETHAFHCRGAFYDASTPV